MKSRLLLIFVAFAFSACVPNPTKSPTPTIIKTVAPTYTPVATETRPVETASPTPTATPVPTAKPTMPVSTAAYQLTFISNKVYGSQGIYAMDVGCLQEEIPCFSEPYPLFEWRSYDDIQTDPKMFSLDWSSDGQQVVIDTSRGIFVCDWDGDNVTKVYGNDEFFGDPKWLPETDEIIFEKKTSSDEIIYMIMNSDGSNLQEMTEFNSAMKESNVLSSPVQIDVSTDGKAFVFSSSTHIERFGYLNQIFYSANDGSNLRQLTNTKTAEQFQPSFSPDGQRIVFGRDIQPENPFDSELETLVIMNLNDRSEYLLFDPIDMFVGCAEWAPFGDWIAYMFETPEGDGINLIKSDGSQVIKLIETKHRLRSIAWRRNPAP